MLGPCQSSPSSRPGALAAPDIDIVIPVYNEAAGLEHSVRRLHRFLTDGFPFSWRIVIADNASVDATPEIARRLAVKLPRVSHLRLERKGRGRALRAAWAASEARVVTYMDVDLSTDLRGLLPLVAPLLSGHSDLAIGTRLAHGSRVVRGPKREFISRAYNRLLHTVLRARFSDAQCGFKAVRRDALDERCSATSRTRAGSSTPSCSCSRSGAGCGSTRCPVDWVDDPDSRVDIVRTAIADLKGVARLLADGPVARFMGIGVLSTLAYAVLFLALRPLIGAAGANATALAITAIGNTAANRRLTFGIRGRDAVDPPPRARRRRVRAHARAHQRRARRRCTGSTRRPRALVAASSRRRYVVAAHADRPTESRATVGAAQTWVVMTRSSRRHQRAHASLILPTSPRPAHLDLGVRSRDAGPLRSA